jgi:phosphotransferase system HPr (HPr) family protein
MTGQPLRRTVLIRNPQGFHMRPAAALVEAARGFQSQATVIHGDRRSDARQVLDLLMLLVEPGAEVILEVQGPDADLAIEVLAEILGAEEPPALPKKG